VFDPAVYLQLLADVDAATDSVTKGRSLEDLLAYVFAEVPGVLDMERNVVNDFGTEELDIAVIQSQTENGLSFMPTVFLVECKNWSHPVDSSTVAYFTNVVRNRGCEVGVLVAASGITGQPAAPSAGHFEVAVAQARDGIRILVVTLDDLRAVATVSDFVGLLRRRLLQVVATGSYLPN
jgi:hypothetical protein